MYTLLRVRKRLYSIYNVNNIRSFWLLQNTKNNWPFLYQSEHCCKLPECEKVWDNYYLFSVETSIDTTPSHLHLQSLMSTRQHQLLATTTTTARITSRKTWSGSEELTRTRAVTLMGSPTLSTTRRTIALLLSFTMNSVWPWNLSSADSDLALGMRSTRNKPARARTPGIPA